MGRTSKFSFPVPGRSNHVATTEESDKTLVMSPTSNGLSKAQRILGTDNNLNIDAPSRDEDDMSWRHLSSKRSTMSISISESTQSFQSTNDTGSHWDRRDQWEGESGILPKFRLHGKSSSNVLGQSYKEDSATGSSDRRVRREDSSSTLKSYYDRQKSPLAISQQTSESSARDLALRKGYPPVVTLRPMNPLLQIESFNAFEEESFRNGTHSGDDTSRQKQGRLDLLMLLPSRNKSSSKAPNIETMNPPTSYSSRPTNGARKLSRRKLAKALSKESFRSQQPGLRATKSSNLRSQQLSEDSLSSMYDSYEQTSLSPMMSQIRDKRVPDAEPIQNESSADIQSHELSKISSRLSSESKQRVKSRQARDLSADNSHFGRKSDSYTQPQKLLAKDEESRTSANKERLSWKQARESSSTTPWKSSAASISSWNTKGSRRTKGLSNLDLQQSSVLLLSSDSEEDLSDPESVKSPVEYSNDKASRVLNGDPHRPFRPQRQPSPPQQIPKRSSSRQFAAQESPFLTIPETTATSSRLSGPWSSPNPDSPQNETRTKADSVEKRSKRSQPTSSRPSSSQPTPPQSPASSVQDIEAESSRFMAVTQQEEALLEALRKKRALMREAVIEEHKDKPPPGARDRKASRLSEGSSVSTIHQEDTSSHEQNSHYFDRTLDDGHNAGAVKSSPVASDILGFSPNEGTCTKTSWAPPRIGRLRADSGSLLDNKSQNQKLNLLATPHARLSAVGSSTGLHPQHTIYGSSGMTKQNTDW